MTSDAESAPESPLDSGCDVFRFNDESFSALGIHAGDCALVRRRPVKCGSLAAVMTPDCGPVLRIVCFQCEAVRLRALNPLYRDLWYKPSQVAIIGAVEKVLPQNKNLLRFPSHKPPPPQPLLSWEADDRGKITEVPEILGLATGRDYRKFLRDRWVEFVHPEEREATIAAWQRSLETGEPLSIHFHFRSLIGGYMPVHSTAQPVLSESGRIQFWTGLIKLAAPTTDELPGRFFYPDQAAS